MIEILREFVCFTNEIIHEFKVVKQRVLKIKSCDFDWDLKKILPVLQRKITYEFNVVKQRILMIKSCDFDEDFEKDFACFTGINYMRI